MWVLGQKDGKPWWLKQDEHHDWVPVSEKEYAEYKQKGQDELDSIVAKALFKHFNIGEQK